MECAVKKKPGKLTLDATKINWEARDGSASETVQLSAIKGMQATPPTAAKMRIKLSSQDGQALMLEFFHAKVLEQARNELQAAIKAYRESSESTAAPAAPTSNPIASSSGAPSSPTGSGSPANSSSIPQTKTGLPTAAVLATNKNKFRKISLEPAKLLQNLELQLSVLRQDSELMHTFQQVVISSGALTNNQFWQLRIHLLVTAAQQQMQARGSYNVLSTIKPTTGSDNRVNINLTREKISDVFDQYPLVRKAYNDNVPKLSKGEFWQRFFMSRLFLVLRGEKVSNTHSTDAVLDPYIDLLHELQIKQRTKRDADSSNDGITSAGAPSSFVNVAANAMNNPETYGNNLVITAGGGTRSLIQSVNGLSARLLLGKRKAREQSAAVAAARNHPEPEAKHAHAKDKLAQKELRLNDLATDNMHDSTVKLHIESIRTGETDGAGGSNANDAAKMHQLQTQFTTEFPWQLDLSLVGDDKVALQTVLRTVEELTPCEHALSASATAVSSEVLLTHATAQEFLRQFWHAYTKTPADAAPLRVFLEKSLDRIAAVADESMLLPLIEAINYALTLPP